jgi:hypothetical protein
VAFIITVQNTLKKFKGDGGELTLGQTKRAKPVPGLAPWRFQNIGIKLQELPTDKNFSNDTPNNCSQPHHPTLTMADKMDGVARGGALVDPNNYPVPIQT